MAPQGAAIPSPGERPSPRDVTHDARSSGRGTANGAWAERSEQ